MEQRSVKHQSSDAECIWWLTIKRCQIHTSIPLEGPEMLGSIPDQNQTLSHMDNLCSNYTTNYKITNHDTGRVNESDDLYQSNKYVGESISNKNHPFPPPPQPNAIQEEAASIKNICPLQTEHPFLVPYTATITH